jgi:uncharacterized protein DUF1552
VRGPGGFHVLRGRRLSRRTVLRGLGAAVALPLLSAMTPVRAFGAEERTKRLVFIFVPNGKHMQDWTPSAFGADYELPFLLEPLAPHRAKVQVLTGLDLDTARAHGDGPGDHARASACFLTGVHPVKTAGADMAVGISADQVAAKAIGRETRFASLELGTERGRRAGSCDSGYACAYTNNISWRSATTPSGKEVNPRPIFERLFAGDNPGETAEQRAARLRRRKSVLDFVRGDAKRLSGTLGTPDRAKLDEYLTGVRELELRIANAEEGESESVTDGFEPPQGIPKDYGDHIAVMQDLLVLALRADLTRVATFMVGNAGSNRSYRPIGVPEGHHHLSHHGGDPTKVEKIRKINHFHMDRLARLLAAMDAAKDGEHSLLDDTMLVYGSGIADGNRHNHHGVPVLLCGGGGGTLTPGRHVRYERGTPVTNLYLSLLDRMGARVAAVGDSTGRLAGRL